MSAFSARIVREAAGANEITEGLRNIHLPPLKAHWRCLEPLSGSPALPITSRITLSSDYRKCLRTLVWVGEYIPEEKYGMMTDSPMRFKTCVPVLSIDGTIRGKRLHSQYKRDNRLRNLEPMITSQPRIYGGCALLPEPSLDRRTTRIRIEDPFG